MISYQVIEHGKPLLFGAARDRGIRLDPRTLQLEVVTVGDGGVPVEEVLVWDETRPNPALAFLAAQLEPPQFPTPVGVFRAVERPSYESAVIDQIRAQQDRKGIGTLEELLYSGEVWSVGSDGSIVRRGASME